jgi:hypothetical protein
VVLYVSRGKLHIYQHGGCNSLDIWLLTNHVWFTHLVHFSQSKKESPENIGDCAGAPGNVIMVLYDKSMDIYVGAVK